MSFWSWLTGRKSATSSWGLLRELLSGAGTSKAGTAVNWRTALECGVAVACARVIAEITAVTDGMATSDETWPGAIEKPTREGVKAELAKKAKCEFGWNAISQWWLCSNTSSQLGSGLAAEHLRDSLSELAKPKLPETIMVELPTAYVLAMADEPTGLLTEAMRDRKNQAYLDALAKLRNELGIES